jgi:hypothetical protein
MVKGDFHAEKRAFGFYGVAILLDDLAVWSPFTYARDFIKTVRTENNVNRYLMNDAVVQDVMYADLDGAIPYLPVEIDSNGVFQILDLKLRQQGIDKLQGVVMKVLSDVSIELNFILKESELGLPEIAGGGVNLFKPGKSRVAQKSKGFINGWGLFQLVEFLIGDNLADSGTKLGIDKCVF